MKDQRNRMDEPATGQQLKYIGHLLSLSKRRYDYIPGRHDRTMTKRIAGKFIESIRKQLPYTFEKARIEEYVNPLNRLEEMLKNIK